MKNINPLGLFDDHFLLETLSKLGDPLQKLNAYINWNIFESTIYEAFKNEDRDISKGGRPRFSRLVMFKSLIIQSLYNLSDDQLEFQIVDRASFKRFLGLKKSDKVPDSKTFWLFREPLIEKGVILGLFKIFNEALDAAGDLSKSLILYIESLLALIGKVMSFENCAAHTELKIEGDRIVIIETSPRLGGDYITSHLVTLSTGIDMEECLIDIALGLQPIINKKNKKASAIEYLNIKPGTVRAIKKFTLPSYVVKFYCTLKRGESIPLIRSSIDRYGYFIISANNRTEILEEIALIREMIENSIILQ